MEFGRAWERPETEAILRRFTKQNLQHSTYKAFAELAKSCMWFWTISTPISQKRSAG